MSVIATLSPRGRVLATVVTTGLIWVLFSSTWPLLPVRWFVTLVHEAGHAVVVELVGGDVGSVTINSRGGGLTSWQADARISTMRRLLVASSGYVGTAVVGGVMLELATRIRRGRIAAGLLAALVAVIALAWVPLRFRPSGEAAVASGSSAGDGRFTILFCVAAVVVLAGLAIQPIARLRGVAVLALATTLCLAAIDDLRRVFDISTRGGHSDAAAAAAISPLPSWLWALLWLLIGVAACGLGLWAALHTESSPSAEGRPAPGLIEP